MAANETLAVLMFVSFIALVFSGFLWRGCWAAWP